MYMSYSAYTKLDNNGIPAASSSSGEDDLGTANVGATGVTVYQVLMPNPVSHYAYSTLSGILEGTDKNYSIIENSERYSVSNLFHILGDFGKRSMSRQGLSYPYWENAARVIEDYATLLLLMSIILLICPVVSLFFWLFGYGEIEDGILRSLGYFLQKKRKKSLTTSI